MIPNQLPNVWLGEARAHLHASVRAMAQPRLRIVHARKAWTFAMYVLINEADDAQPSELDAAAVFTRRSGRPHHRGTYRTRRSAALVPAVTAPSVRQEANGCEVVDRCS